MSHDITKPIDPVLLDPVSRIKKIIGNAEQMKVNPQIPLQRYYKSLLEIDKMAKSYIQDMNLERAFILLYRFSWFAVSELKSHPDFQHHDSEEKRQVSSLMTININLAEQIKTEIRKVYALQAEYYKYEEERRLLRISNYEEWFRSREEALTNSSRLLKAAEEATHRSGMIMGHVLPVQVIPDEMHSKNPPPEKAEIVVEKQEKTQEREVVPPKRPNVATSPPTMPGTSANSAFRPIRKNDSFANEYPMLNAPKGIPAVSSFAIMQTQAANLDKTLAVPADLVEKFLNTCRQNTINNVETCGILAGKLIRDKFVITHVIIPKQVGTANDCSSTDEVEVARLLSMEELLTLGWIHTHPTQSAFLSAVDLHSQFGYQKMMTEAIAIVAAPKFNSTGTFVLTPEGMETIGKCKERGFHPHPESVEQLFTNATHVHYSSSISAIVVDLRNVNI